MRRTKLKPTRLQMIEALMVSAFPEEKSIGRRLVEYEEEDEDDFEPSEELAEGEGGASDGAEIDWGPFFKRDPVAILSPGAARRFGQLTHLSARELAAEYHRLEDAQQWYSRPSAAANFDKWLAKPFLSVDEATALSFGKAPEKTKLARLEVAEISHLPFPMKYRERYDHLSRYVKAQRLSDGLTPAQFEAWISERGLPFDKSLDRYLPSKRRKKTNKPDDEMHHHTLDLYYKVLL